MRSLKPTRFFPLLILLLYVSSLALYGAEQRKFERVDYRKGLSQNHITVIHQDKRGFMWFGTSDGLVCYDGYDFIPFRYDPRDSTSISGNYIFSIFEDSFDKMWIRTSGGGLNCYDPDTQAFRRFYKRKQSDNSLSDNEITVLYEDRQKRLWIGTKGGGLNRFQRSERTFQTYRARSGELSGDLVSAILQDSKNRLWVGTSGDGISRAILPDSLTSEKELPLKFRQYGSSREAYLPQLSARINSLLSENKPIVSQLHPG
ncbi:MAG: two-component regulator propeller domain-containing protein, partial [Calditrichota bacterium]